MRCLTCVAMIACIVFLPVDSTVLAQQETERERERIAQWERRMVEKRIASNYAVLDLLPAILDSSGFVQVAEMTDQQLEQARDLYQRLQHEQASIKDGASTGEERRQKLIDMRTRFLTEFNEIFVPFQLEQMLRWTPRSGGLPKMLTETPVGTSLGLSDDQLEKIRQQSNELAEEIREFHDEVRRRARDIVLEELDDEQRRKLTLLVGEDQLERIFSQSDLRNIYSAYLYDEIDSADRKRHALGNTSFEDGDND